MTEKAKETINETVSDAVAHLPKDLSPENVMNMVMDNIEKNELIAGIIKFFQGGWMGDTLELFIKLIIAFLIYKIGSFITRRVIKILDAFMGARKLDEGLKSFLHSIADAILKVCVVLAVLSSLGFNLGSLVAIFAAAGVAIGLALKDSLSNIASGVMVIMLKPFKVGDFVEAAGTSGIVEGITVFSTIFKSLDNKQIVVPNSHITAGTITNFSAKPTRRVDLVVGIGYGDDIKKARDLIVQILEKDKRVLKTPAAVVAVDELGDSSVNFVVRPWVKSADYWDFKWDFLETVKNTFDENGVSIPFPQKDVYLHTVESGS